MIRVGKDYNGFAERFAKFLNGIDLEEYIDIIPNDSPCSQVCDVRATPFAINPIAHCYDARPIVYNQAIIEKCELTQTESDACILHEIGHLINKGIAEGIGLEVICDSVAAEVNMALPMLSALYKMQDTLQSDLKERIEALSSCIRLFRPEWTCGRYNKDKQVAIMYNLITGVSYYFESFSANVIGEILKADRNGDIKANSIVDTTGICMESLCQFFMLLEQCGLLTETIPSDEGVMNYRKAVLEARKSDMSWMDKSTKEKLPMNVTNAEQAYSTAVDDSKTICSCMFELTYRCSEMCIHCYNPGATRNDEEASHRADHKELTLEDYKRIVDDMYDNGLVKVCLSGGDPFSKEFTWELLDYLYLKGIAVDIFTNGQRIVRDVKRLADYYPRLVGISIYSGIAEDHDAITRIPGSWKRSMQVVRQLSELAVPMNLKCCIMQPNLHSYYMVADLSKKYGAIPEFEINITESNDGDICAKQLRLTEEQLDVVLRDDNLALYVGKEAPNYGGQKRDASMSSCGAGGTGFCLSPNGDLRACTAFTQVYGNLSDHSVLTILSENQALKEWRTAVIANYTECGKHDYCDYCNLCAGLNYTEHGDFRKPAESNCYMAKCRFNLAHRLMEHNESMTRDQLIQALHNLKIEKPKLQRKFRIKG